MKAGPHYVRVLGPLDVTVNRRPVSVTGRRKKALLAALCLRAGTLVPSDALVEAVWPDGAPAKALGALRVHVSHLRRMLRVDDTPVDPISTGDDGYGFMRGAVDIVQFEQRYETALIQRDRAPGQARKVLAEGLDLWRGETLLPELSDVEWVRPEITRLTELRRDATDELVDLRLRSGEHAILVPELEACVETDPLNEHAWAQLMIALYRAGQQSRALDAYTRARRTLIEELGIEPAPELSQLEHRILTHDPDLVPVTRAVSRPEDVPRPESEPVVESVRALGPDGKAVLDAAAVLGGRVPISMLSAVSTIDGNAFLAALGDCERTGLINADGGEATVAGPTAAAVVLDALGRVALTSVHARAADALRDHPLADPDRQADALARHSVGAIGVASATQAIQDCLAASTRAEDRAAFDAAAAHYRNARLTAQHLEGVEPLRRGLLAAVREADCLIRTGAVPGRCSHHLPRDRTGTLVAGSRALCRGCSRCQPAGEHGQRSPRRSAPA